MKRFHVFSGPDYYPGGGIEDYVGSFETLEEAKALVDEQKQRASAVSPSLVRNFWWQTVETQEDGSLKVIDEA